MARGLKIADLAFLGRVGNSGVTPASFSGLLRWYKADYYATLGAADGDRVGGGTNAQPAWFDETGSGDNAFENTNGPTYKTNIIGSKPIIRFDITNPGPFLNFAPPSLTGDFTVMAAAARTGTPSFIVLGLAGNHQIRRSFGGSNVITYYNGSQIDDTGLSGSATDFMVVTVRRSSGVISLRQNKTSVGGGANTGAFNLDQIGASGGQKMDLGELMMWNTALSDSNVDQLYDQYLKPRWTTLP